MRKNPKKIKSARRKRPLEIPKTETGLNRKGRRAEIAYERGRMERERKQKIKQLQIEKSKSIKERVKKKQTKAHERALKRKLKS